jgi:hypothetical protein
MVKFNKYHVTNGTVGAVMVEVLERVKAAIGNTVQIVEVDGAIYSLALDRVVRVNDADTGEIVHRISYPTMEGAAASYRRAVADAQAVAHDPNCAGCGDCDEGVPESPSESARRRWAVQ